MSLVEHFIASLLETLHLVLFLATNKDRKTSILADNCEDVTLQAINITICDPRIYVYLGPLIMEGYKFATIYNYTGALELEAHEPSQARGFTLSVP